MKPTNVTQEGCHICEMWNNCNRTHYVTCTIREEEGGITTQLLQEAWEPYTFGGDTEYRRFLDSLRPLQLTNSSLALYKSSTNDTFESCWRIIFDILSTMKVRGGGGSTRTSWETEGTIYHHVDLLAEPWQLVT